MTTASTEEVAYWISPEGVSFVVRVGIQDRSHHQWMRAHRGMTGDMAAETGWHRVTAAPVQNEIFVYGEVPLAERQQEEVNRLALLHGTRYRRYRIRGP